MLKKTATFCVSGTVSCPHVALGLTAPNQCHGLAFTLHLLIFYATLLQLRVSDSLCEELEERPDAQEDCNIPCPRDCILSPWSPWSDCPNQCQEGRTSASIRLRQRNVLAQQGPGNVKSQIFDT